MSPALKDPCLKHSLSPQEVQQALASRPDIQLIDVRTVGEHQGACIQGSSLIGLSALEASLDRLDRRAPVLLYCASGGRSAVALDVLARHGFKQACHLEGGLNAWVGEGLPLVRQAPRFPWS